MKKLKRKLSSTAAALIITALFISVIAVIQMSPLSEPAGSTPSGDYSKPTIIIDPGHGGIDGGCVSVDGTPEKGINLSISLYLRDILQSMGYNVVMTRDADVSIYDKGVEGIGNQKKSDMKNRLEIINSYENAVAVSIHQNQFTDGSYSGAQMFYSDTNDLSQSLATAVQNAFVKNIQPDNSREIKEIGNDLYLLYYSNCPMIMAECGFLSNEEECIKLKSEDYQKQVAFTIACGITEFLSENY